MKKYMIQYSMALLAMVAFGGCTKSDFLNAKPDQSLVVPTSLKDLQALLDNDAIMNGATSFGIVPQLGETGADDYFLPDAFYVQLKPLYQNCYTWASQPYTGTDIYDWDYPYRCVFYSNVVLEGLSKITPAAADQNTWNIERASALFYRAHIYYQLAQVFAAPYNPTTAQTDPGIPLRMVADVNAPSVRATVQQTYDQVINDLTEAAKWLPSLVTYKTRPSKQAAYALLSRTYLSMKDYDNAQLYADSSLKLQSTLLDYNTFSTTATFPFSNGNAEVIFTCNILGVDAVPISAGVGLVDSILYSSYLANDLRQKLFYKAIVAGGYSFLGSYDGSSMFFAGLATDEMYLIRAECYARKNNSTAALADLNTLLKTRWKTGTYTAFTAADATTALKLILSERRKELVMRALRWTDLRRLNTDPSYAKTLIHTIQGKQYTLAPNDPKYVYPIPDNVISFNPGMVQNPR